MKRIPLTQNQVALVDDEDYERLSQFKWHAHYKPLANRFIAQRHLPQQGMSRPITTMHREILGPIPDGQEIDHKNRDTLDNRRSNLRICSHQQNCWNRRRRRRFQGIQRKGTGYMARIRTTSGHLYLGIFKTMNDASEAYNSAAKIHHGEFACLSESEGC